MKAIKILIIGFLLMGFNELKADTIDHWKVSYNKKIVGRFNANTEDNEVIFFKSQIHAKDSIFVQYGNDTPCWDCKSSLTIVDQNKKVLAVITGKGTFARFGFKANDLQVWGTKHQSEYFELYYSEEDRYKKKFLVRIKVNA